MKWDRGAVVAIIGLLALYGCDNGARQVEYNPQRGISSDISASMNKGPTASKPGMLGTQEPVGAFPWEIPQSR